MQESIIEWWYEAEPNGEIRWVRIFQSGAKSDYITDRLCGGQYVHNELFRREYLDRGYRSVLEPLHEENFGNSDKKAFAELLRLSAIAEGRPSFEFAVSLVQNQSMGNSVEQCIYKNCRNMQLHGKALCAHHLVKLNFFGE